MNLLLLQYRSDTTANSVSFKQQRTFPQMYAEICVIMQMSWLGTCRASKGRIGEIVAWHATELLPGTSRCPD